MSCCPVIEVFDVDAWRTRIGADERKLGVLVCCVVCREPLGRPSHGIYCPCERVRIRIGMFKHLLEALESIAVLEGQSGAQRFVNAIHRGEVP